MFTVARFWFSVGQADAFAGIWDCAPVSAHSVAAIAYRRGQMVAAGTAIDLAGKPRKAHWYVRNRAMVSGTLR
jgi:hypothetical protein